MMWNHRYLLQKSSVLMVVPFSTKKECTIGINWVHSKRQRSVQSSKGEYYLFYREALSVNQYKVRFSVCARALVSLRNSTKIVLPYYTLKMEASSSNAPYYLPHSAVQGAPLQLWDTLWLVRGYSCELHHKFCKPLVWSKI